MPRKSAAALAIVTPITDHRPPAPDDLTPEQAAEWREVVGRMPNDWFTRETHQLLAAYCRHVTAAKTLSAEIDRFKPEWLTDSVGLEQFGRLLALRDRETRGMSSLATRMRLTQGSRYRADKTATATAKPQFADGLPPWERYVR
jgi:hypothetical protein